MPDLADDIARIAALRGRTDTANLVERAALPPVLQRSAVEWILKPNPDASADLRWFDMLPPKSRAFIRDTDVPLSAAAWVWNLEQCRFDEDELIKAVQYLLITGDEP